MFTKNKFLLLATTLTFFTGPVLAMDSDTSRSTNPPKKVAALSPEERAEARRIAKEEEKRKDEEEERQRAELQKALKGAIDSGTFKIEERKQLPEIAKPFWHDKAVQNVLMAQCEWFKEWMENPAQAKDNAFKKPDHPMYGELGKVHPRHPEFKNQSFTNPLHPYYLVAARHDEAHPLYNTFANMDPEHVDYFKIESEAGSFKTTHPYYKLRWAEDPNFKHFPEPSKTPKHPQFLIHTFYKDFGNPHRWYNYRAFMDEVSINENHPNFWESVSNTPSHKRYGEIQERGITTEDINALQNSKLLTTDRKHPLYYLAVRTNPQHPHYEKAALTDSWHPLYLAKAWTDPHHEKFWEFAERHPHHPGYSILSDTKGHFLYDRTIRQEPYGSDDDLALSDPLHPKFYSKAWTNKDNSLYWKLAEIYPFHPGYGKTPQK